MGDDDFVPDIKALLEKAEPPIGIYRRICRVPFYIRRLNEDAYTPKVVSIGPFHCRHPPLQYMKPYKVFFCKAFLDHRSQASLDSLVSYIQQVIEPDFRLYYSDTLELSKQELVNMILVDSCFIFELFLRYLWIDWPKGEAFLSTQGVATNIRSDLLLLENQLPFRFLDQLYNLSLRSEVVGCGIPTFIELTCFYFGKYNRSYLDYENIYIEHFTDLIRTFHLQHPPERRPPRKFEEGEHLLSANELLEAGIRFKVNTDDLLDLKFSRPELEIPQLILDDETESLFFNMVALEQCHYREEAYITDYIVVWDFLINTGRDVDVLVEKEILVNNRLGDSASPTNLFNGLWRKNIKGLQFNDNFLLLFEELNNYCNDPRIKLKATLRRDYWATLRRDYCGTPWKTAVSMAGIVIVVLTILQSVCSVLQVIQGSQK